MCYSQKTLFWKILYIYERMSLTDGRYFYTSRTINEILGNFYSNVFFHWIHCSQVNENGLIHVLGLTFRLKKWMQEKITMGRRIILIKYRQKRLINTFTKSFLSTASPANSLFAVTLMLMNPSSVAVIINDVLSPEFGFTVTLFLRYKSNS